MVKNYSLHLSSVCTSKKLTNKTYLYLRVDESSADEKNESEEMERVEVLPTEQQRKGPDDQRSDGIKNFAEI